MLVEQENPLQVCSVQRLREREVGSDRCLWVSRGRKPVVPYNVRYERVAARVGRIVNSRCARPPPHAPDCQLTPQAASKSTELVQCLQNERCRGYRAFI